MLRLPTLRPGDFNPLSPRGERPCRRTNHKYIGFEIDPVYYKKAKDRPDEETAQVNIFDLL